MSLRAIIPLCVCGAALAAGTAGAAPSAAPPRASAPPPVAGCVPHGADYREAGSRRRHAVALTFDGGPTAAYTPHVLAQLRKAGAHATFFLRGQFIPGHEARLRMQRREGHELANHSFSHPHFPSTAELLRTTRLIRHATGFTPCLFRAPYGSVDGALIGRAHAQRMLTIGWDVDSWDSLYENLSASTIEDRVLHNVRPGSIILMHDGEGSHPGTLRALGPILRGLRRRGLRVVTVSELLGLRERTG